MTEHVSFRKKSCDIEQSSSDEGYAESLSIPMEAFDGKEPQPGDKYTFEIQGEIKSVDKDGARVEIIGGCCLESYDEDEFDEADSEKQDRMVEKEFNKGKNKDSLEEYAGKED